MNEFNVFSNDHYGSKKQDSLMNFTNSHAVVQTWSHGTIHSLVNIPKVEEEQLRCIYFGDKYKGELYVSYIMLFVLIGL